MSRMNPLEQMLSRAMEDDDDTSPILSLEEQAGRLRKAYEAYTEKHDFAPGQLVIGKKDCRGPIRNIDTVHVVIETGCTGFGEKDPCSNGEGVERSLRVGIFDGKHFNAYLVDPAYFEPYAG